MNIYNFEDLKIGLKHSFSVTITQDMVDCFLKISNDVNILHIDSEYAIKNGFLNKVVHGLLTSSFYSTLVGVYLPGKYCLLKEINIKFLKPVYIEDSLFIEGEIVEINDAYKHIELKAIISNQHGQKVSKAVIKTGFLHA